MFSIDLALNITCLVWEAGTGWKLLTPWSKCIDCPAVCNQKLFPVSSSEKCVMQNLGVIWRKFLRVFKDHFRAITAAWAWVPHSSKVHKFTLIAAKDNALARRSHFSSWWLLPGSPFFQRFISPSCLPPCLCSFMPFPMGDFSSFLGFLTTLVF